VSDTDPGGTSTITEALGIAGPGTTIMVLPGTYRESLILCEDVVIQAEEGLGSVTIEHPYGVVVFAGRGAPTLRGLVLRGGTVKFPAVQVAAGLRLEQCDVVCDGVAALHLRGGALEMRGGTVRNSGGSGLLAEGTATGTVSGVTLRQIGTSAVVLIGGANPVLRDCTVSDVGIAGILCRGGAGRVERCTITDVRGPAVLVEKDGRLALSDTVVRDTAEIGIMVTGAHLSWPAARSRVTGEHGSLSGAPGQD
jgi:hypothetical protein